MERERERERERRRRKELKLFTSENEAGSKRQNVLTESLKRRKENDSNVFLLIFTFLF